MVAIHNAQINWLNLIEQAADGTGVDNAQSGCQVLFLGDDGALHLKDPGGSVTDVDAAGGGGIPSGTSFPGGPTTNDLFFRTDRGLMYFYDGTRWVTTTLYITPLHAQRSLLPTSATTDFLNCAFPHPTADIFVEDVWMDSYVVAPNDGSRYWTLAVFGATLSTVSNAADTVVRETAAVDGVVTNGSGDIWVQATITRVGSTPGGFLPTVAFSYRLVG